MLPINIKPTDFKSKEIKKEEKDKKSMRTACSQQALANELVSSSLARNPNATPIQQATVQQ